ncbi:MAG: valine--tRNA ligase [Erysipelotrichaceae bacterium]|nr:valine--tRNA ligase [Erysipelotrichaceae bacterium]
MLDNRYDHLKVEENQYDGWISAGYFTAGDTSKKPYCLVIPPPNVTGKLHLGHSWDNTLQDIITRYKRMCGFDTLYLPGMDHAGIATQAKVDQRLKEQGISRYDIGREKFLEQAWAWKEEYAGHIRKQWAAMGVALDYTRERFTLDEGLSRAVRKAFVQLYKEGLIYQGERIINWDPEAKTALSNIEVIYKPTKGYMYHFIYDVVETGRKIVVATTRPETMFGDVCVVVHPDDERYRDIVGLHVINPANHEPLPIITDDYIDIEFGTGAMKCTPAHDPNDFIIGEKYGFDKPVCINPDGTMNALAGKYEGLDRYECRERLVERIRSEGHLDHLEDIEHNVGYSERTDVIVEPYLSKQWFVSMKPLAEDVLKYQKDDETKIHFYPERFEKTFLQWLENIEDWCISRQLWWGHRIPVWYHKDTGEIYCEMTDPADPENWIQDEDVLDTWFSSALWPFTTLNWPDEDDPDYKRYYSTDCLVTGYDIIFFWVARMAFQARHFTHDRPFRDVLIHGLVRDEQGRKMSKSLGNGVDPMDVKQRYGADALRFFLTTNSTPGADLRYSDTKVEAAWNFINKIWNASRFVQMNTEGMSIDDIDLSHLSAIDSWLLGKLNKTIASTSANMEKYEFAMVGNELYSFVWNDFCSWYIELSKSTLNSEDPQVVKATRSMLLYALIAILKLLHPFMPFVTEKIYGDLPHKAAALCVDSWPQVMPLKDENTDEVDLIINVISIIRQLRVDYDIKPSTMIEITLRDENGRLIDVDAETNAMLSKLAKVTCTNETGDDMIVRPLESGSLAVSASRIIDYQAEYDKLIKEQQRLEGEIRRSEGMLGNERFIAKAPREKIDNEKEKLESYRSQYAVVTEQLAQVKAKLH